MRFLFRGLPRINIYLLNSKQLSDINLVDKLPATIAIVNGYGSTFSSEQLYSGSATIKGRGNSSFSGFAKKPLSLVFTESNFSTKKNVPLFGFPTNSNWNALTNSQDKTFCRTGFTNSLSEALGLAWAARYQHAEIYIYTVLGSNTVENYWGLYTITEKVEQGLDRINIAKIGTNDNTGVNLTGGYVIEKQPPGQVQAGEKSWTDSTGATFTAKVPDADKITTQQINYIKDFYNNGLYKLYNVPFNDLVNGYRSVYDTLSYAQYLLLQGIGKNSDAYFASWYTTKDRNGKLVAGPMWDADAFYGLFAYAPGNYTGTGVNFSNPNDLYIDVVCPYYAKMLTDPYFKNLVASTFTAALPSINQTIVDFEKYVPKLYATGAVERDRTRWPGILTDPNYQIMPNYDAEVKKVLTFIKNRMVYQSAKYYRPSKKQKAFIY